MTKKKLRSQLRKTGLAGPQKHPAIGLWRTIGSSVCPVSCHGFGGAANPRPHSSYHGGGPKPKLGHLNLPRGHSEATRQEAVRSAAQHLTGWFTHSFLLWRPSVALVPAFPKASSLSSISYFFQAPVSNLRLFLLVTSKALYDHIQSSLWPQGLIKDECGLQGLSGKNCSRTLTMCRYWAKHFL